MIAANAIFNGLVLGSLLALPALAITLVFGIARFPNVAAGDTITLGAYSALAFQVVAGLPLVLAALFAALTTGVLSVVFYFLIFRKLEKRSMVSNLVASIGLAFVIRNTITFIVGYDQYSIDLPISRAWNFGGFRVLPTDLALMATAFIALAFAFFILHRTSIGRHMRAVADNPELAQVSGIQPKRVMCVLWLIAGAFAGLGGVLFGAKAVVIPELGWEMLLIIFGGVILGGIGSPVGAIVGMLVFGVALEITTMFIGAAYRLPIAFSVLLILLLMRPRGLFGRAALGA